MGEKHLTPFLPAYSIYTVATLLGTSSCLHTQPDPADSESACIVCTDSFVSFFFFLVYSTKCENGQDV